MLVRAAGRKHRRHTSLQLAADFQQLYLPFLCPAQLRWSSARAAAAASRLQTTATHASPERTQSRNLASLAIASEAASSSAPATSHPPLSGEPYPLYWDYPRNAAHNAPTSSGLLVLKHTTEEPQARAPKKDGIGGSSGDLLQNLHTCLRVRRFARAEMIMQRLAVIPDISSTELLHAQEAYLSARLQALSSRLGDVDEWESTDRWFQNQVIATGASVPQEAFITMIRAAVAALQGSQRERAVRRYAELSQLSHEELMDLAEFDDNEFMTLGSILSGKSTTLEPLPDLVEEKARILAEATEPVPEGDIPKVLEVLQRGMGLKSLKEGLRGITAVADEPQDALDPEAAKERAMRRQRMIEEDAAAAAIARWRAEDGQLQSLGIDGTLQSKPLGALMWQWYSALLPALQAELQHVRSAFDDQSLGDQQDDRRLYGAHLETVPIESVAATTIIFVMSLLSRGRDRETRQYTSQLKLSTLTTALGKQVQQESQAEAAKQRAKTDRTTTARHFHTKNQKHVRKVHRTTAEDRMIEWPTAVKVKLGAMLVSKLIETARLPVTRKHPRTKENVTQMQPAFMHKTTYVLGKKQGYLSPSIDLIQKVHREPLGGLIAKRLPMVVEPIPWTGFDQGGYLNYANQLIRFPVTDPTPRDYALAAIEKGDLNTVFDALNVLSKIPWKINENVLRVQVAAWNSGHKVGKLAPLNPDLPENPPEPDASDANARKKWLDEIKDIENKRRGNHSQRCHQNFQLEIARAFRKETFYFPHNIDFRGRAYPIPPYLNHMGADNARALMLFGQGKELGPRGLRWLKIHLSNVFGYDKASLQEREDFINEHLDDIYDSAAKPLTGRGWWLQSEDAWQTLAACFELKNALDSPDPTKFISHLPTHQDGTCNGLQHYAALGGDPIGARQVNLEPGDRPADVYTAVAEAVKSEIEKEYHEDHPCALILHGKITRKVVKQPVMTNVYGVTYYGAKEQVKRQIETILPNITRSSTINHVTLASYIAKKIFKSLGEMFSGAQAIQRWLGHCADRISTCISPEQIQLLQDEQAALYSGSAVKAAAKGVARAKQVGSVDRSSLAPRRTGVDSKLLFKTSVIWTTPLRLPVVQPYRTAKRRSVKTNLQAISLMEPQSWDPVSKRKQLQAFPPNFIHSLDATHMMLSALKCNEKGMTFASIHDSFWTHACDMDDMGIVLRDAFVHMHSEDVVGRLREEFSARYKGSMYLASFDGRKPAGKAVLEHQTAARKADTDKVAQKQPWHVRELLVEVERLRLLNSEDAAERERGQAMVTSASIVAAHPDAADDMTVPDEIQEAKLGQIPADAQAAGWGADANVDDVEASDAAELAVDAAAEEDDTNSDADDASVDKFDAAMMPGLESAEAASDRAEESKKAKRKAYARKVYVWLPLAFPTVPEKGTFDVSRLKESRYFFH